MSRMIDRTADQDTPEKVLPATALRTYQQIAEVLAERDGTAMTQAHVARMCRAAEMKIALLLLADPAIRERYRPGDRSALSLAGRGLWAN